MLPWTRSAGLGKGAQQTTQGMAETTRLEMVRRRRERAVPLCEELAADRPQFRRRGAGARRIAGRSWMWALVVSSTGAGSIGESHNSSRQKRSLALPAVSIVGLSTQIRSGL